MPLPKNRSRSVRKIFRRVPKRGTVVHYKRRKKGKKHHCAICKSSLQAVHSSSFLPSSQKAPNRKFGGQLCTKCASRVIVIRNRLKEGLIKLEEVEIKYLPYVRHGV
ncbi:MAG: 50S ribosomal protein L34e [Candidatus Micrarchaeota archaeon]|nr:50S ribosomal protein L34e [Candidatus Micrarchaeota archaeon]